MAPHVFIRGEEVPYPSTFYDAVTGRELLIIAVATALSPRALSVAAQDFAFVDLSSAAKAPDTLRAALSSLPFPPAGLVVPADMLVPVCKRPSPIRFAVVISDESAKDAELRVRLVNADVAACTVSGKLSEEESCRAISKWLQEATMGLDIWSRLYGAYNVVEVDGIANIRDFGGYPTRDGKRVRRGIMFRSGDISQAPESSLHHLHWVLGISHVHDLRSDMELEKKPYSIPEKLAAGGKLIRYHTPVNAKEDYSPDALAQRFGLYSTGPTGFSEVYPPMAVRASSVLSRIVSRFLLPPAFSTAPPNWLMHCTAGKDRTGILACLILSFLGVPDDLVARDYAASEILLLEGHDPEEKGKEWMENVGKPILGLKEDEWESKGRQMWENMRSTKPIAMLLTIRQLRLKYGANLEGYYKDILGLDDGDIASLRRALLERFPGEPGEIVEARL
ncbi:tyrosine phosphatase family-domain-containing protein [Hyaloraphidium curvatum]|nr:tyrosine phosphatase family-domain-containing protein [Hyaloraphidium curvatum]